MYLCIYVWCIYIYYCLYVCICAYTYIVSVYVCMLPECEHVNTTAHVWRLDLVLFFHKVDSEIVWSAGFAASAFTCWIMSWAPVVLFLDWLLSLIKCMTFMSYNWFDYFVWHKNSSTHLLWPSTLLSMLIIVISFSLSLYGSL